MFAGVFRAPVQPAELARAAGKEMDRRKKLGVGKVYAPTLYSVLLSPPDGEQLGGFSDTLAGELETYLIGYARDKGYELSIRPRVRFLVDEGLKLGRYEVIGELLSAEEIVAELGGPSTHAEPDDGYHRPDVAGPASAEPPQSPAFFDAEAPEGAVGAAAPTAVGAPGAASAPGAHTSQPHIATVTIKGIDHDIALTGERLVIGRLKACDICLADANASREHAALEREGDGWALVDLGSTNGTTVNGARIDRVRLRNGDRIVIGVSEIVFNEPRS